MSVSAASEELQLLRLFGLRVFSILSVMSEAGLSVGDCDRKFAPASPTADPAADSSSVSKLKRKGTGPRDFNQRAARQRQQRQNLKSRIADQGFAEAAEEEEEEEES